MIRRSLRLALLGVTGASLSSCFAVTDLDRFKEPEALAPSNFSNLKVSVRGMTSHVKEKFEYRVVDGSNVIQSRGFIIPLGGVAATFNVQNAVPKANGPFRLDFYADHDLNDKYDPGPRPDAPLDHAWRLNLDDSILDDTGTYVVSFDHNTSFANLLTPNTVEFGKPVTIHLKGMNAFKGKRIQVRIQDASISRVVAMYRVPGIEVDTLDLVVPGMIETGVTYAVEVYTDDNNPPEQAGTNVRAFRLDAVAGDSGLETTFDGNAPGTQIANPPPP